MTLLPVVLSGGSGTRLWPLSRERRPKQLLALRGGSTLLQDTLLRAREVVPTPPLLICNTDHRFMVAEQARACGVSPAATLLEPVGRNTAPAIAVAAHEALQRHGEDCQLLVLPADHVITDVPAFVRAATVAARLAASGRMATFGIRPTRPETGFGYLHAGAPIESVAGALEVAAFIEKPDAATAEAFLAGGAHYWNSGMFLFPARRYLELLTAFEPEMARCSQEAWQQAERDEDFVRLAQGPFTESPAQSVDYAVMERLTDAAMVPLDAGWDDVGSFAALWELGEADAAGNVSVGDVLLDTSRNCYLRAEHRLLAALGVEDLVIIETADAVLVTHRDASQDVKRIVDRLKDDGRMELLRGPSERRRL